MIVHAGLVAKHVQSRWRGALIQGLSGSGKSDLAIRVLEIGFRLVADDQVRLSVAKGRLFGCAPASLANLLEARGLGLVRIESLRLAEVRLLVLCGSYDDAERLPELSKTCIAGVHIPTIRVRALDPSAPAKLCRALEMLGSGTQLDYDAAFP